MAIHINLSLLFLLMAALHLVMNGPVLWHYIKRRRVPGLYLKRELSCALALAVAFLVGTLAGLPPFAWLVQTRYAIQDSWEQPPAATAPSDAPLTYR